MLSYFHRNNQIYTNSHQPGSRVPSLDNGMLCHLLVIGPTVRFIDACVFLEHLMVCVYIREDTRIYVHQAIMYSFVSM